MFTKDAIMEINGLKMKVNMPAAVKRETIDGEEVSNGLPPYNEVRAYCVDDYPSCPANWMHGSKEASSYFIGVEEGSGLWFDFNDCFDHENDVAVLISVQGVNPITGQKQDQMKLEKYEDKCPVHNCSFGQNRFCKECDFKWPAQNFISTKSTHKGLFWLDGFRSEDGKVRQYVFTAEKLKGIAQQLIGDDAVYAIGVAFFLSKKKKFRINPCNEIPLDSPWNKKRIIKKPWKDGVEEEKRLIWYTDNSGTFSTQSLDMSPKSVMRSLSIGTSSSNFGRMERIESRESYEVGAGALINQDIASDKVGLDYWEENPAGFIYINYVDNKTLEKIIQGGKRTSFLGKLETV